MQGCCDTKTDAIEIYRRGLIQKVSMKGRANTFGAWGTPFNFLYGFLVCNKIEILVAIELTMLGEKIVILIFVILFEIFSVINIMERV